MDGFVRFYKMEETLKPGGRISDSGFAAKKSRRESEISLPGQHQEYELAFHLLPSFNETEIEQKRREIEELISENGGLVSRYGEIKKIRLAYPIKREKFSNFGYIDFFAPKNIAEKINKNLLLNENVLRYLLIKRKKEKAAKPMKLAKTKPEKIEEKQVIPETEETKELDKKIEEILEKL